MTPKEKADVIALRNQGFGYKRIAQATAISVDTIKSFCRRTHSSLVSTEIDLPACPVCGKCIIQTTGRKQKKFCSDKCRNQWWNSHLEEVKRKAVYHCVCLHCRKEFWVYGNANRKYCCHDCYIKERFGGSRHDIIE